MDAKLDDVVAHSECTDVSAFKTHRLCIIAAFQELRSWPGAWDPWIWVVLVMKSSFKELRSWPGAWEPASRVEGSRCGLGSIFAKTSCLLRSKLLEARLAEPPTDPKVGGSPVLPKTVFGHGASWWSLDLR